MNQCSQRATMSETRSTRAGALECDLDKRSGSIHDRTFFYDMEPCKACLKHGAGDGASEWRAWLASGLGGSGRWARPDWARVQARVVCEWLGATSCHGSRQALAGGAPGSEVAEQGETGQHWRETAAVTGTNGLSREGWMG